MLGAHIAFDKSEDCARLRDRWPWMRIALGLSVFLGALCWHWGKQIEDANFGLADLLVGLAAMCLLIGAAPPRPSRARGWLSYPPHVALGTFSYSVYLMHWPVLGFVQRHLPAAWHLSPLANFLFLLVVGMPLILAVSYLFYLGCERPFLVWRRRAQSTAA